MTMVMSFLLFLFAFVLIGISSAFKGKKTKEDYYLASQTIPPWLVGLSAVATNNSGYMFIGVIGYTYATGIASLWLMVGWIAGDYMASMFIHSKLKLATEKTQEVSYAGVLSHWHGEKNSYLQRLIGALSLIFLLVYASAQFVAGSKALHVLFGWEPWSGAVIGAVLVILYCFAGGIRASIWTDAAQSFVMIIAMGILLWVSLDHFNGLGFATEKMSEVDGFLDWYPKDLVIPGIAGGALFAISWLFAGFSVIGQPHIMVRFMTLQDHKQMKQARLWYYVWFILFYAMATGVGLLSRIYLTDSGNFDAELALPTMAIELMPPALVGLVLAGIFAATMSTADSLILSCSAAVTHDLLPFKLERQIIIKFMTVIIVLMALGLALINHESVFSLVIFAWSGLASAFAPLLFTLCLGWKPNQTASVIAVLMGLMIAIIWRLFGWHNAIYEGLPGMMMGFFILSLFAQPRETK